MDAPGLAYYRAMVGQWRCPLDLHVTDWGRFWRAPLGLLDRLRILSVVCTPRLLGPYVMETKVVFAPAGLPADVRHWTRVKKWGVTFFQSREVFALAADGVAFTVSGTQRFLPLWWQTRGFGDGKGAVDADAQGAAYTFEWLGAPMQQRARRVPGDPDALELTQDTDWSHSVQRLRRFSPT
jgi:hypothetical protein